ncbi:MAG: pentapeptide repeat-containing protein [Candidatus Zixiibacteriota bacterium]
MSETTKRCQVEMHDGKSCGRDLYDEEFCIFHSKREDKNIEWFQRGLDGILNIGAKEVEYYDLSHFIFPQGVFFPKKFSKSVNFWKSVFKGEVDLENVSFEGKSFFLYAVFEDDARFDNATFNDEVNFENATFEASVSFNRANFKGVASFDEVRFKNDANFGNVTFDMGVGFGMTVFNSVVDFSASTFKSSTYFWGAVFKSDVDFLSASFDDALEINAEAHQKKAFKKQVDFRMVTFSTPEKVVFQKVNLSKFRFLETDVRKVSFIDVDWNKKSSKGRWRVYDEVSMDPDTKNFDYSLIEELYRRLRKNYEDNLKYSEAGDFYIGEMEMWRKAETSFLSKIPLFCYKAISNYGESYYRPLCWILAILLLFPIFFMIAGIQPVNHEQIIVAAEKIKDYSTSFWYSTSIFSFIRDKKCTTTNNWGDALFVTESILSPIMLAFLLLALRRRFKR